MQNSLNKNKMTATFIIVLMMASVALVTIQIKPVAAFPPQAAEQPYFGPLHPGDYNNASLYDGTTYAALSFAPTTIGVGQMLLVNFWINPAGTNQYVWVPQGGFVITITKPDGTQDIVTTKSEPATFAYYFTYYPDQVGNWTLQFSFLGAYFPAGIYYNGVIYTNTSSDMIGNTYQGTGALFVDCNTYYKPSQTGNQTLVVQANQVPSWPLTEPTDYWSRPASINNRGYWPMLGNWPGTGWNANGNSMWDTLYPDTTKQDVTLSSFTPWVTAPNTPHVLWDQLGALAGLIGGPAGQFPITSSPGAPSVIYAGRCYQTMTVNWQGIPTSCAVCYDLQTGQQYYAIPTAAPYNGITPSWIGYYPPEASGTGTVSSEELAAVSETVQLMSVSGSYLRIINPFTGALTGNYSIAPLSGGTFVNQIDGYVWQIQDLGAAAGANRYCLINWTTRGWSSTTTIASKIVSNTTYQRSSLPTYRDYTLDLGAVVNAPLTYGPLDESRWLINCVFYRLSTGAVLYNLTTDSYPDISYHPSPIMMDHGEVAAWSEGYFVIFNGLTGTWFRSQMTDYPWSSIGGFGAYAIASAYGLVLRFAYNYVYAFNWTDGRIVWKCSSPDYAPFETPYTDANGNEVMSFNQGGIIADGKLYIANTEHTPTFPLTRGWALNCINMTDGTLMWRLDNPMSPSAISDGYLVAANSWDGYMYVIGKGKSATTVEAPDVSVPQGTAITIRGTVLDQSPAQPNTPCVSASSMETEMEYLHLQQPIGGLFGNSTITGVPVILQAIDSNNNVISIGTVTSNGYYGTFGTTWTPPHEGQYQIIATFAGDDSYGSSGSATTVTVGPAPTAAPTPAPTVQVPVPPDNTGLLYATLAAVIIAIIVSLIALFRKQK